VQELPTPIQQIPQFIQQMMQQPMQVQEQSPKASTIQQDTYILIIPSAGTINEFSLRDYQKEMLTMALTLDNAYKQYSKVVSGQQIIANVFSIIKPDGSKDIGFVGTDGKTKYFVSINDPRIGTITQDGKIYDKSGKILNKWPPE